MTREDINSIALASACLLFILYMVICCLSAFPLYSAYAWMAKDCHSIEEEQKQCEENNNQIMRELYETKQFKSFLLMNGIAMMVVIVFGIGLFAINLYVIDD